MEKHLFAVYLEDYSENYNNLKVTNSSLYHRVVRVLRLPVGAEVIVFDKLYNSIAKVEEIGKKHISLSCTKLNKNKELKPNVTLALGMLKRDNLEQVVYNAVALGVNDIQLLFTSKSQKSKFTARDKERLEKIIISAAEQSKNYSLANLHEPTKLEQFLADAKEPLKIFFDVDGSSIADLANYKVGNSCLLVGPEGDFSAEEKGLILNAGFKSYKLTPTVLRSVEAATVGAGVIRSFSNKD